MCSARRWLSRVAAHILLQLGGDAKELIERADVLEVLADSGDVIAPVHLVRVAEVVCDERAHRSKAAHLKEGHRRLLGWLQHGSLCAELIETLGDAWPRDAHFLQASRRIARADSLALEQCVQLHCPHKQPHMPDAI